MISGILNVYKEQGYTSQDVVTIVRGVLSRHYSCKIKAGHTGTLDPGACGALPVCIGTATKIADYIMAGDKTYRAEIILGMTTDTEDVWGKTLTKASIEFDKTAFKEALNYFEGEIKQTPPMYSAVKIGGKKLYELAREGKQIERPERSVTIKSIEIIDYGAYESINGDSVYKAVIEIECSKGTYIRTLCKDIGEKLGTGACMGNLTRLRTGCFFVSDGVKLQEFKDLTASGRITELLIPIDAALGFKKIFVTKSATKRLYNGNSIIKGNVFDVDGNGIDSLKLKPKELVLMYDHTGSCVGIHEFDARRGEFSVKTMLRGYLQE